MKIYFSGELSVDEIQRILGIFFKSLGNIKSSTRNISPANFPTYWNIKPTPAV